MNWIKILKPPQQWHFRVSLLLGIFFGLIVYVFYISNAYSYLSDNPQTCVNCHIMKPQKATWAHSSHRETAVCNDCHVPHNNIINKYYFKAKDGLRHATLFTLRKEPQVIEIKEDGKGVVQGNCIRCHFIVNENVNTKATYSETMNGEGKLCWQCHIHTPHGRVNSLSSVSFIIEDK